MQGLFHPTEWLRLRQKLYLMVVTAGLAGLLGWVLLDAQVTLASESLPAVVMLTDVRPLTNGQDMDGFGSWSPDGRQIAFMRDGAIWLMNADGSGARALTTAQNSWDAVPAWRPDGKQIAFARLNGDLDHASVMVVDPATAKAQVLVREKAPVGHIAWAPGGRSLYYTTAQRLMQLDVASGKTATVHTVPDDWEMLAGGLAIAPNGKTAVFGAGPRTGRSVQYDLWTLDLTKRDANREPLTTGGGIMPVYDPAGKRLAYRNPRQNSGIYVMDPVKHATRLVVADEGRALYFHPAFSPDGKRLLLSRLLLGSTGGGPDGTRFTSHLYLHTLSGAGGE